MTAETLGACGRGFRPLQTTSPHHRPVTAPSPCWTSWMPSLLALRHKTATTAQKTPPPPGTRWWRCPRTAARRSLSRINARKAPGPDNILGVYWETGSGTHWCLHRHFQHLTKSDCCPHMLQSYHHHSSPEEVISILLQWLPSSSTYSYHHEVALNG